MKLKAGGSVRGTVVDSRGDPVSNARIVQGRKSGLPQELAREENAGAVRTDAQGVFVLEGLSEGAVTLTAVHPEHPLAFADANVVSGKASNVRLVLEPAGSVAGTVLFNGQGGVRFSIDVCQDSAGCQGSDAFADGDSYRVCGLRPGGYTIQAARGDGRRSLKQNVTVVAGQETKADFNFAPGGASLSGRVTYLDRVPDNLNLYLSVVTSGGEEIRSPTKVEAEVYSFDDLPEGRRDASRLRAVCRWQPPIPKGFPEDRKGSGADPRYRAHAGRGADGRAAGLASGRSRSRIRL